MKTVLCFEKTGTLRFGIVKAKDWFGKNIEIYLNPIYEDFFVVAQWYEYNDGETISYEGKQTVAICSLLDDAIYLYDKYRAKKDEELIEK